MNKSSMEAAEAKAKAWCEIGKITGVPVRFFMYGQEGGDIDFIECTESDFLAAEGAIEYERHTVFANGVSQICLTKNPF